MIERSLPCALAGKQATMTLVGRGAVANVWRVDDPARPSQTLGVKVVRGELRSRADISATIAREFELLRTLQHPCIPRAFATFDWHGRKALLFDFVRGRPLLEHVAQGPLAPALCRQHAISLMDMLRHTHTRDTPVVHSDLSPENLIVDDDNNLHLIDFGAALAGDEQRRSPGKPSYMSPEQAQGRDWDARSDLYQAGVVLFEMLTGQRYNPGATSLARRAFSASPDVDIDAHIDVPFRAVLRRLLDPDPVARWPSADACLVALERLRPSRDRQRVDPPRERTPQ